MNNACIIFSVLNRLGILLKLYLIISLYYIASFIAIPLTFWVLGDVIKTKNKVMVQNCSAKQEMNLIVQKTKVKQKRKHACRNQTKKKIFLRIEGLEQSNLRISAMLKGENNDERPKDKTLKRS